MNEEEENNKLKSTKKNNEDNEKNTNEMIEKIKISILIITIKSKTKEEVQLVKRLSKKLKFVKNDDLIESLLLKEKQIILL